MQNLLILNDIHIGVVRSAGTTLDSRKALRTYLQESFAGFIGNYKCPIVLNGDIFDSFDCDPSEVLQLFYTLCDWVQAADEELHLVQGNHDIAKNSERTSAFSFLSSLLLKFAPDKVRVYDSGLERIMNNVWVIPHMVNQDRFDLEMEKAMEIFEPSFILLHANVDNQYAEQSDHSLNVSDAMIRRFIDQGHKLIFAHEHQHKTMYGSNVIVCGNQWPSSIADCLKHGSAQADGKKYAHLLIWDHEHVNGMPSVHMLETWNAQEEYCDVEWDTLSWAGDDGAKFVRVSGKAKADQAEQVISTIAKYRQQSDAFVITNSVQIEGLVGVDDLELTKDRLADIDIEKALRDELTEDECKLLDFLLTAKRDA